MARLPRYLLVSLRALLSLTVLLGVIYPAAVWVVGQTAFRSQANGSLVEHDGATVGSSLIGQAFDGPEWFHPRPSAGEYDAMASGASNLAPTSELLLEQVEKRRAAVAEQNGVAADSIPPDALTASGSGLDPHITPEYALLQVARVSQARRLEPTAVESLVDEHTQGRSLGFLGQPRVNVLELNQALEQLSG